MNQVAIAKVYELVAGRELDMLIAEKFFGWQWFHTLETSYFRHPTNFNYGCIVERSDDGTETAHCFESLPKFTTEIASAWMLVDKIISTSKRRPQIGRVAENEWRCDMSWDAVAYADTAPLAICRAALLTVAGLTPLAPDGC